MSPVLLSYQVTKVVTVKIKNKVVILKAQVLRTQPSATTFIHTSYIGKKYLRVMNIKFSCYSEFNINFKQTPDRSPEGQLRFSCFSKIITTLVRQSCRFGVETQPIITTASTPHPTLSPLGRGGQLRNYFCNDLSVLAPYRLLNSQLPYFLVAQLLLIIPLQNPTLSN